MRVFRDIKDLPKFNNAVVTIGSFDGVHQGHQQLISRINQLAKKCGGESTLVTFYPHPRKVIYPNDNSLSLLNTLEEKLELCSLYGIDNVVVVPFSIEFSQQTPQEYIENFLLKSFNPRYIVIGYDHKFGLNRVGNIDFLKEYEKVDSFNVIEIQKHELEDIAVSSSKIRTALQAGDIATANSYLGSSYSLSGKVIHGDKIGQTIGYPTANIELDDTSKLIPMDGVYAVTCKLDLGEYQGMMYIGRRPTLSNDQSHKSIEVNLFDFDHDIYLENIRLEIIEFIRGDVKFKSLDLLKAQLKKDKIATLGILSSINIKSNLNNSHQQKVCIAILNYNGEEYLESFLPSVLYSSKNLINVAVLDNASTDQSVEYVREWHPEIQLVELSKNHGFAGGYNEGLKEVNAEYIVLLNSDVMVEENWLDPIIEMMDSDSKLAACQPKILSLEHKDHFEYAGAAGGFMDKLGYPYCRGRILDTVEEDHGQYDDIRDIDWASGAAIVIRSEIYHKLGGLDKDYFAHMEEIDLCWRIKRAGYYIKVVPQSVVFHLGGGTLDYLNPRKVFLNFRNNLNTLLKNESWLKLIWLFPLRLLLDGVAGVKYLIDGQPKSTWAIIKSHFAVYGGFFQTLRKRSLYNRLIREVSIGIPNCTEGVNSILTSYYLKGKKHFTDL